MTIKERPQTLAPQCRTATLQRDASNPNAGRVDREARTVELAFSSEEPVDMWYGTEILSHAPGAMRTGLRQQTLPALFNHDRDDLLGVIESISISGDRRGRALVRFGKDERGEWAMNQVDDGVLVNVSFLYRVFKFVEDTEAETLTAIDWEPYEISLVTIPADPTVGVGRADAAAENGVQIERSAATTPTQAAPGVQPAPVAQPSTQATQQEQSMRKRHLFQEQANDGTTGSPAGGAAAGTSLPANRVENGDTAVAERQHQQRGAEAERTRITEIEAVCKKYDISADVRTSFIQKGASVEQARLAVADIVLERAKKSGAPSADFGDSHNPDMTEKEKARYSMIRAVNAAVSGKWDKAGFELECSNEVAKRLGRGPQNERGFFIPTNIQFGQRATYTVGTVGSGTTGGTMVATNLLPGSFIEVLRNKARVLQLGATMLSGLVGSVDIPRQTGQSSSFWTTEGSNTSQSEATFDKVSLAMKTIGTFSQITRNMLMQSTPDIDMIARADLLACIALGVDLAALSGSGSAGQPLGIANTSGIGSVVGGTNGANISIDNYIDLETQLTQSNAPEESLAYLGNAKTIGSTKKLKSTTGQYLWTNSPGGQRSVTPGEINGYPMARSNQARSNLTKGTSSGVCSELFFGAWSEVLIGEWGVVEIVPNPYDAAVFKNGGVLLRVLQSLDIALRHPASFSVMSDALTP
jgi:HK97 family phage major capsid protein/HK97 family phage prohead protease